MKSKSTFQVNMKVAAAACFLIFSALVSQISGNEYVQGSPLAISESGSCSGVFGIRCLNCTHLEFCANIQVAVQSCSAANTNLPYCNSNFCSSEPPAGCPVSSFICTTAGLLPNVGDCTRYFLCDRVGGAPREFQCSPLYVYDSRTGLCRRRRLLTDCQVIDCLRVPGQYLVFPNDRSVFVYCRPGEKIPILYRCPDSVNSEFNSTSLQCSFVCRSEGRFADRLDCHKFYECYRSGISFASMHNDCGESSTYDPVLKKCRVLGSGQSCEPEVQLPQEGGGGAGGGESGGGTGGSESGGGAGGGESGGGTGGAGGGESEGGAGGAGGGENGGGTGGTGGAGGGESGGGGGGQNGGGAGAGESGGAGGGSAGGGEGAGGGESAGGGGGQNGGGAGGAEGGESSGGGAEQG